MPRWDVKDYEMTQKKNRRIFHWNFETNISNEPIRWNQSNVTLQSEWEIAC